MLKLRIDDLLKEIGKSRYWLVKAMDSTYNTVTNLCNNTTTAIRMETIEKLLLVFDCTPNELFDFSEVNNK